MQSQVNMRVGDHDYIHVVIGMATCGITADARPVLSTLTNEVRKRGLTGEISITQTDCTGLYQYEPTMGVMEPGKDKTAYVRTNVDKALEVVGRHLAGGHPVKEYTMGVAGLK